MVLPSLLFDQTALVYVLVVVAVIVAAIKGNIRWGGFVVLLAGADQLILMNQAFIVANPLPPGAGGEEVRAFHFIPGSVALVMLWLAYLTFRVKGQGNPPPARSFLWMRWIVIGVAYMLVLAGIMTFLENLCKRSPRSPRFGLKQEILDFSTSSSRAISRMFCIPY